MKVIIIGCGPSGLLAAHAVEQSGHPVKILSRKAKSETRGAMYLHKPIPDIETPETIVYFDKIGTREGYATKVYGRPDSPCSWDIFPEGKVPAWNLADVYDRLWERYESRIIHWDVKSDDIEPIQQTCDLVINTAPALSFCTRCHPFQWARIWVRKAEMLHAHLPKPNIITYNGDPMTGWYRCSQLFGWINFEYGHPVPNAVEGRKPIQNSCNCHPEVLRLGRFGKWEKKVLTHHAYEEALSAVQ
jgi:hypothetical protein